MANNISKNNISTFPNIPISPLLDNNNDPDIDFYNNLNINFFDFQPGQIRKDISQSFALILEA